MESDCALHVDIDIDIDTGRQGSRQAGKEADRQADREAVGTGVALWSRHRITVIWIK